MQTFAGVGRRHASLPSRNVQQQEHRHADDSCWPHRIGLGAQLNQFQAKLIDINMFCLLTSLAVGASPCPSKFGTLQGQRRSLEFEPWTSALTCHSTILLSQCKSQLHP